jgi:hypothetical protein
VGYLFKPGITAVVRKLRQEDHPKSDDEDNRELKPIEKTTTKACDDSKKGEKFDFLKSKVKGGDLTDGTYKVENVELHMMAHP